MTNYYAKRLRIMVFIVALFVWGTVSLIKAQGTPAPAPISQTDLEPLVPCTGTAVASQEMKPCVTIVTDPADLTGIWKTYVLANPAFASSDGMGYIRFNKDGTFFIADTPENTASVHGNFPYGTIAIADGQLTFTVTSQTPPGCDTGVWQVRVIKLGDQPIALSFIPIKDQCAPRQANLSQPALWVSSAK